MTDKAKKSLTREELRSLCHGLHRACERGDLEKVKSLIAKGAKPDIELLSYAAGWGQIEIIKYLATLPGVYPGRHSEWAGEDFGIDDVITFAISNNKPEAVKTLIELPGKKFKGDWKRAFIKAAARGHLEIVKLLAPLPEIEGWMDDIHVIHEAKEFNKMLGNNREVIEYLEGLVMKRDKEIIRKMEEEIHELKRRLAIDI